MNRFLLGGLFLAFAAALALRCLPPEVRPLHNDEGVNAVKFAGLWKGGGYHYDPNEHHGPSLPYATLAWVPLTGARNLDDLSDRRLRSVDVVFGVGLILLLGLMADGLGRRAVLCAAVFLAVSPAMVFYSRYYIHEMPLVFFACLTGTAVWRYRLAHRLSWALLAGAGAGLMHATKETFIISLVAAILALGTNWLWGRCVDASSPPARAPRLIFWHALAALGAWAVVWFLLFSSFLGNPAGPLDSFRTYQPWLSRAGGASPHLHPWWFYFERLLWFHAPKGPVWTEAFIAVLALIGGSMGFSRKRLGEGEAVLVRFLALYTAALVVAYCLISYKTPWCLLGFWHGAILLAGVGASVVLGWCSRPLARIGFVCLLMVGVLHLVFQAWEAVGPLASSPRNPYVYAQNTPGTVELVDQVKALAAVHPDKQDMLVKVIAPESDYWPLPWYLRDFTHIGWWDALPPDPYAPVMLVAASFQAGLDERKTHQMPGYFEFRPNVFFELYVETNLWRTYIEHRPKPPPEKEP